MPKFILALLATFVLTPLAAHAETKTLVVAGGCFWCVESDFDKVKGVISTTSGYAGGDMKKPTYENHEGNQEAVKVEYDPAIIAYDKLIAGFLRTIDVTDDGGQFCDRGNSYVSGIWTMNDAEKTAAEKAIKDGEAELGKKIVTPVKPFTTFTAAEDYHQNYHSGENRTLTRFGWVKQSYAYEQYRLGCGRDDQVKSVWGKGAYPLQKAE
jgi:peptide-methionine (S)-S-oxide reductase